MLSVGQGARYASLLLSRKSKLTISNLQEAVFTTFLDTRHLLKTYFNDDEMIFTVSYLAKLALAQLDALDKEEDPALKAIG